MQQDATARRTANVTAWTDEQFAVVTDPSVPYSGAVAWLWLWDQVGRRDADVTHLVARVTGLLPESTWRSEALPALVKAGWLVKERNRAGHTFLTIHAEPAACRRHAPDPQRDLFARDPSDGTGPEIDPPPPTVPLHGTSQAASAVTPADPGARNPRGFRADSAPPYQDQRERQRLHQDQPTKDQEPKKDLGLGEDPGRAESARFSRGRGAVPAGLSEHELMAAAKQPAIDLGGDWQQRETIAAWILQQVPGACPKQAGIAADAILGGEATRDHLFGALAYARKLEEAGELRKDFASAFFGAFKGEARRRGFDWPKKRRPR